MCFQQVTTLDLSQCSPWGYSLFQPAPNGEVIGICLKSAFPSVTDVVVYVRDALDIQMVAWLWPDLELIRLVRWHQRAVEVAEPTSFGYEIEGILQTCKKLKSLDLSKFYCWTEDVPPALQADGAVATNLLVLNLLKLSPEGFKGQEVCAITGLCPNLEEFYILCEFDHRLLDSVGDEALLAIATNCQMLRVLHLVDFSEWGVLQGSIDGDGYASEDSKVSCQGLEAMLKALPHLQELAFLLSQNMREVGPSFELCSSHCKELHTLKLSHFHGVCRGPQCDGISLFGNLKELMLRNCADLTDDGLRALSSGCPKLSKLGLRGCKLVTEDGLRACVANLAHSLKDVEVSFCQLLPTAITLKALQPIESCITHLHLNCIWDEAIIAQEAATAALTKTEIARNSSSPEFFGFGPPVGTGRLRGGSNTLQEPFFGFFGKDGMAGISSKEGSALAPHSLHSKRRRLVMSENGGNLSIPSMVGAATTSSRGGQGGVLDAWKSPSPEFYPQMSVDEPQGPPKQGTVWKSLEVLSLWIPVGESISLLPAMGLGSCPSLRQLKVRVEGDSRLLRKPTTGAWGIQSLVRYPKLAKVALDLSEVTGFSLSAPEGFMDLSLWDRHYLTGVERLHLTDLDYWPPSDKDVNMRNLSLPAAGLLSQCRKLRKLFVHGTAHEHFLMMLVRARNLRDVQLRGDYYPAPEHEPSTEMRTISCQRFDAAVAKRGFPD